MRSNIPVLFITAGIVHVIHSDLVVSGGSIPSTASSVTFLPPTRNKIGIIPIVHLSDTSLREHREFILNRIRRGGDTLDLDDSSNAVLDDDDKDDDDDVVDSNDDDNDESTASSIVLDGSFKDALLYAKQQGRLLIAFIPEKPIPISSLLSSQQTGDAKSFDHLIMSSFTSLEVTRAAQQAPPKSKKIQQQTNKNAGSFVLWYCSGGMTSSEAVSLFKRIQGGTMQYKNAAGQKRPILLALYPQTSTTPRLLTQHHCSPPPLSTEKFVEWLRTIRKKNKKYYYKLQKQIQEYRWEQERKHGYKSSIQSDIEMKQRAIQQELERQRLLQLKTEKNEQMQQRRIQLFKALDQVTVNASSTPKATTTTPTTTTTIALRFADGRSHSISSTTEKVELLKRTFNEHATIRDVFHWIDAVHEIPYETITLQTMNGKRTFVYSNNNNNRNEVETKSDDSSDVDNDSLDVLLHESGLGKMIGLRVIIKKSSKV